MAKHERKAAGLIRSGKLNKTREIQQARAWGDHADNYETLFVMPFESDVINPMLRHLKKVRRPKSIQVADIGCGKGHLLEILVTRFRHITAIDFSEDMLRAAQKRLRDAGQIAFHQASMTDLSAFHGAFDLITATSSIVMPDPLDRDRAFSELFLSLKPGGTLMAIVPSMDSVFYHASLAYHAFRREGRAVSEARRRALDEVEAGIFDFALGLFSWDGLRQKFYHPFEIERHMHAAGFTDVVLEKVEYAWGHAAEPIRAFPDAEPVWDWFFSGRRPE